MRIYIHHSDYRSAIEEGLESRDLGFSFSHHRALWRMVTAFSKQEREAQQGTTHALVPETSDQTLLLSLRNLSAESTGPLSLVHHLLYLDEKSELDTVRPTLVIRAAIACLERNMCEKRYRLLLKLWSESDFSQTLEKHAQYQKQIIAEKNHIAELDKERSVDFADLAAVPWLQ